MENRKLSACFQRAFLLHFQHAFLLCAITFSTVFKVDLKVVNKKNIMCAFSKRYRNQLLRLHNIFLKVKLMQLLYDCNKQKLFQYKDKQIHIVLS